MALPGSHQPVAASECAYYEEFYGGSAQQHLAKPAVVAFRKCLVARLAAATGANATTRVLSIGSGIGDTELLLAPNVAEVVGIDLSSKGVRQAQGDAEQQGIRNVRFLVSSWETFDSGEERFDLAIAVFFLHHLTDHELDCVAGRLLHVLKPRGIFYSLDPSTYRLSGAVGKIVVPHLVKKYQAPGERQLERKVMAARFEQAGFEVETRWYDSLGIRLSASSRFRRLAHPDSFVAGAQQ
jgi:SAM-dependent methyltransferase